MTYCIRTHLKMKHYDIQGSKWQSVKPKVKLSIFMQIVIVLIVSMLSVVETVSKKCQPIIYDACLCYDTSFNSILIKLILGGWPTPGKADNR
jgi:hypothetical protein